jgi:hypothetical protein
MNTISIEDMKQLGQSIAGQGLSPSEMAYYSTIIETEGRVVYNKYALFVISNIHPDIKVRKYTLKGINIVNGELWSLAAGDVYTTKAAAVNALDRVLNTLK